MRIILIAIVSLIVTFPLFISNSLFDGHDIYWHISWSEQFYKALTEGVFYPRWVDTPSGYGSPTFIFYSPLSFYIISIIHFLIHSHFLSIKIAIFLSFFFSGLSMYFLVRKLHGEREGLVSGVLYQIYPFHLIDLFIRGSLPSLFAYIWFPLILLFIKETFFQRRFSTMICMSLAYAGLIMTHLVSSYMFTFVMIGYGLYIFFIDNKKGILRVFCAMIFGLGLSAIYLIPVIMERIFVHIEFIKVFNYRENFLLLYNMFSQEGFYKILDAAVIIDAVFSVFFFTLLKRKYLEAKNTFFVLLAFLSVFLTTPFSIFIWKYIPYFSTIQFPWRWLMFSGLSVTIITGSHIVNMYGKFKNAALFILLPFFIFYFASLLRVSFIEDLDSYRSTSSIFAPREYRPIWVKNYQDDLPAIERIKITEGEGSVDIIDWKSNKRVLSVNGETKLRLRFSTFYYPGWEAKIDGKRCDIMIDKDSGSMVIEVPEGKHSIELNFKDIPARFYGKVISVISFVIIAFILLFEISGLNKKNFRGCG